MTMGGKMGDFFSVVETMRGNSLRLASILPMIPGPVGSAAEAVVCTESRECCNDWHRQRRPLPAANPEAKKRYRDHLF
jgi:hypothetical protein